MGPICTAEAHRITESGKEIIHDFCNCLIPGGKFDQLMKQRVDHSKTEVVQNRTGWAFADYKQMTDGAQLSRRAYQM